ncbi:response regulator [Spirosoma sp. HMF4905]|uniref:Response regulator n=1 Tax=Spirosoma arboris TaxID=2682092 RepID=A0A7K1SJR4_9BACT|nr:response regulator [Spirosoma arboris]MVM34025.1 response regulator [Spirosoma arboris]
MTSGSQICIVDDAADYLFLLGELFSHYFPAYSVSFFADGDEFLAALPYLNPLPRLILLDRHMPHLGGHQTLLGLKEHATYKKIPVVMMSADASADEINGCYEAGANSFIAKAANLDTLKDVLERLCRYWLEMNRTPTNL